jgi:hypothetical protein
MSLSVPPAFAQAELEYRQQRIKADFAARPTGKTRRIRLTALFQSRRRPNLALRRPQPAPYH